MEILIAWVLFPLLLAVISAGLGFLVECASGVRLAGALVLPVGLAALIALTQLTTYLGVTAPLTTPLVALVAVAGLVIRRERLRALRPDWPPLLAAAGVFVVLGAPVFLSGMATFAGYTVLGDTAIQFVLADRLLEHGRDLHGLAGSSYQAALNAYFGSGYPVGAQTALGAVRPLTGQDIAWVFQPYLAFLVANLALALYALTSRLIAGRWERAAVAFLAAQPALVVAYALQGSIKEVATAWLVALLVAVLQPFVEGGGRARAVLPLAVLSVAAIATIGPAVAPWLAPILLAAVVLAIRRRRSWREVVTQAGAFVVVVAVLSLPTIAELRAYADVTQSVITASQEAGNLLGPLRSVQVFGIWLSNDYRILPAASYAGLDALVLTHVLIGVAIASGLVGVAWAIARRRAAALPLLYVAVSVVACVYVVRLGSPWADGKALMIASPAVLLAVLLGPTALLASRTRQGRLSGGGLAIAVAVGVLGSNALAYHSVSLAPRDRLAELAEIGRAQAGHGPTLYTEFEEFGKHFLRDADPVGATEAFTMGQGREGGPGLSFGYPVDLDDLTLDYVEQHPTLVLRRSPDASRPPANYRLQWSGRWYDVWTRTSEPKVLEHLALGSYRVASTARPQCADLALLARHARAAGARLAVAGQRPPVRLLPTAVDRRPPAWNLDGGEPFTLDTSGQGEIVGTLKTPTRSRYRVWLGGSFGRPVEVEIDGRRIGRIGDELSGRLQYAEVGDPVELTAGVHAVRVFRGGGSLAPGNGAGPSRRIGPLVLTPAVEEQSGTDYLTPSQWRSLCGRSLDWIEVVRP